MTGSEARGMERRVNVQMGEPLFARATAQARAAGIPITEFIRGALLRAVEAGEAVEARRLRNAKAAALATRHEGEGA